MRFQPASGTIDQTRNRVRWVALAAVAATAVAAALVNAGTSPGTPASRHAGFSLTPMQLRLISGTSQRALFNLGVPVAQAESFPGVDLGGGSEGDGAAPGTTAGGPVSPGGTAGSSVFPGPSGTCAQSSGNNVRLDSACQNYADPALHGRSMAQNETAIAINPTNHENLVASANDYMRGDGNCGAYYSTNGGRAWNGTTAPMGFVRGSSLTPASGNARQYWQAGGDTAVAYNSEGTAFLQCQVFNRGAGTTQDPDLSSGVLIFRSANNGASWDFPGRVALSSFEPNGSLPNGVILEDKPYFAIDANAGSTFRDRIYITWTSFTKDGGAYIWETASADGGETWSARKAISGNSPLCNQTYGVPTPHGTCNENQFSDPFVGSDGALYVVYDNYNNAVSGADNRNQVLLVKSTDGGATFSAPVKVTDFFDLPDCVAYTGQDAGRACVVNKGATKTSVFRATNYPSGAVDPTNPSHVVVNIGSYINRNSKESTGCTPNGFSTTTGNNLFTGAGTAACNNQILQSDSTNAGATFNGTTTDPRSMPVVGRQSKLADEFWQWTGINSAGKVVVGYYDRQYGADDTTGASDYSVSINNHSQRVTTASSPAPTEFGGLFLGDYDALSVAGSDIWVSWADDRNPGLTSCPGNVNAICTLGQDEDAFGAHVQGGDGQD
ncbi:MAG TPA: sialidase family protein [Candidatus Udaeobacter sp.]|nr:sialidase family protein [Candidatus Udaeobacter sp.]